MANIEKKGKDTKGRVDLLDCNFSIHLIQRKVRKWWKSFLYYILVITLQNCNIINFHRINIILINQIANDYIIIREISKLFSIYNFWRWKNNKT